MRSNDEGPLCFAKVLLVSAVCGLNISEIACGWEVLNEDTSKLIGLVGSILLPVTMDDDS